MKMQQNKYTEAEKIGRDLTIQMLQHRINLVELDYNSRCDFSASTLSNQIIWLETKYRNIASTDYQYDILEINKLEGIQASAGKNDLVFYLMIFNDNTARLHYISKLTFMDIRYSTIDAWVSSVHKELGKVQKPVLELPNNKAQVLTYDKATLQ